MSRLHAIPMATAAAAAAAVLLMLSGCHGSTGPSASATPSGSASASAPSATPTPTATDTADCSPSQLQIVYSPTDGTAGHFHGVLTFGNLGQTDCILTGYATVTFQDPTTKQALGPAASHVPSESTGPADASVSGFSTADLTITDAGVVANCTPVSVTALLVTPPGMSHTFVVPIDATQACSEAATGLLSVSSNYIPAGS
jgi:hypothetical protein